MKQRLQARVTGRVQGVGYRYFVQATAVSLGLTGSVRNLADGAVEVAAEGEPAALQALVAALHRGPTAARVTNVQIAWQPARGQSRGFSILPTSY